MESPVVVDKPPEYHGGASSNNERGFPFDEEEGTGAWSELAARHPDIAVRLRQRPATWARKRRPSSQDAADDFGDSFSGFDRFPFDDIPSEFRGHFPSHWNRRFGSREEAQPQPSSPQPQPQSPQQQTIATQTEEEPGPSQEDQHTSLPNYGLRNTVDLGQKSAADPSLSEADERTQRSMSAPPDNRTTNQNNPRKMSGHQEQQQPEFQPSNVRHIPIFVEGRDEPVINKTVDRETHFGDAKPAYAPPPPQPHVDREQYFPDDVTHGFHHPPNFSRTFGTPFNKGFRQGPQPFVQQKVYPQTAFARGTSPQRSQSPKPHMHPEEYYKVPVHHEQAAPRAEPPSKPSQPKPQQKQPSPRQQTPPQQSPPKQPTPPPQPKPQQPSANDPITQILSIQTDVLNLMTEVENFKGTKKDKQYMFLDEMLTRNLIKLDNIETEGKENIRQARKEAIKCIQKCIAVLEAKAESNAQPPQDVDMANAEEKQKDMANDEEKQKADEVAVENGEVEMKEATKEEPKEESQDTQKQEQSVVEAASVQEETKDELKPAEGQQEGSQPPTKKEESQPPSEKLEVSQPEAADTRPDESKSAEPLTADKQNEQKSSENADKKKSPKKSTKSVKKRDKSKDKESKEHDSNKEENVDKKEEKLEVMQVDGKGDNNDSQTMEVDGAPSQ